MTRAILARLFAIGVGMAAAGQAFAQGTGQEASPSPSAPGGGAETASPVYKPPLRGAPGGRVGGASRSAAMPGMTLPVITLLAPADHAGMTARPDPTLYYAISQPSQWPMQLTISAPLQPAPVLEVTIPPAAAAGLYPLRTAQYNLRLQPGIDYTWSVSVVLEPHAWSHNVVASAMLQFDPTPAAIRGVAALAEAGLWYDAVAAAVDQETLDRGRALQALMRAVGLRDAAGERALPTQ